MLDDPPKLGVLQSLPLIKDNPESSCLIIFRGFSEVVFFFFFFGLTWDEGHVCEQNQYDPKEAVTQGWALAW